MGIWIAFDDATEENGALYAVPGSHNTKTNYFMCRRTNSNGHDETYFKNEKPEFDCTNGVLMEAPKGSVVLLHGDLVHYSKANHSSKERHAYTIHCVDSKCKWEEDNWIQRRDIPFRKAFEYNP